MMRRITIQFNSIRFVGFASEIQMVKPNPLLTLLVNITIIIYITTNYYQGQGREDKSNII
jgi:hypothetical protein